MNLLPWLHACMLISLTRAMLVSIMRYNTVHTAKLCDVVCMLICDREFDGPNFYSMDMSFSFNFQRLRVYGPIAILTAVRERVPSDVR